MPRKFVKWSTPYRDEPFEQPEYDLIRYEKEAPIGRIVLNAPEKRNPLGYERLPQIEMAQSWFPAATITSLPKRRNASAANATTSSRTGKVARFTRGARATGAPPVRHLPAVQ